MTKKESYTRLKGFRDILPEDWVYWSYAINVMENLTQASGFERIEIPLMEKINLYVRSVGEDTDIVNKEMYYFDTSKMGLGKDKKKDKDESIVALRPEFTAGIVRAYLENGMQTWAKPVSLYAYGKCFRHENPQSGRYRELSQFDVEMFGEEDPAIDAHVISLLYEIFKKMQIKDIEVHINSIGCSECRGKIKKMQTEFFKKKQSKLCEDCKKRLKKNPMRVLDCKNEKCQSVVANAPVTIDNICDDCKKHFMSVLEFLDEAEVPYNLAPNLVRGLDYYNRTVFEISTTEHKRQNALAGGGRYDYLIESFGGEPTPAIGFGIGIDRVVDYLQENSVKVPQQKSKADVFIVQLGEEAKKIAIKKAKELRELEISIGMAIGKDTMKAQLKSADKVNALFAVIIGQREAVTNTAILRDMRDSIQETVELEDLSKRLLEMVSERKKEEEEGSLRKKKHSLK